MRINNKFKISFFISFCFAILLMAILRPNSSFATTNESDTEFIYLSDINYKYARAGWGSVNLNRTDSGGKFSIRIENGNYSFDKGIWAHASSEIIYDLTNYKQYAYFTTYMGVNTTSGNNGNGVKFYVYTSPDGNTWNLKTENNPQAIKSSNNSIFVKIDIKDAKFLKLIANDNGSNGNDHSVYVDAKLIKENYEEPGVDLVPSIEELDAKIKGFVNSNANLETNQEYKATLLKRELISQIGPYALRRFYLANDLNKQTFEWLTGDVKVLEYFLLGGQPEGGYYNTLTQLARLYEAYKEDFKITQTTKYGTVLGDLYTRMAIAMSLTHSQNIGLWLQSGGENRSDALRRYQIYKDMHKNGNFVILRNADGTAQLNQDGTPKLDVTQWFENYTIEEMRYIFNNLSDDEETLWLNEYTQSYVDQYQSQYSRYISPHPYMDYRWENLSQPEFYDPNKKEEWDTHFKGLFSKYNVTYRGGLKKIWMLLRNPIVQTGAVCGGISKVGSSVRTSHGIPCVVIGQPGHAAMIYYWQDAQGRGYWNLDNDVSGWQLSEKGERLLLGWGNAGSSYARGSYQVVYVQLAQEALNDYESLVKCEEQVMLAKIYEGNAQKQEEIYRKALEIQPINLDAWIGLINTYNNNSNKTENDFYDLAEELAENMKYFPLPMQHLTNLIKPKLTSIENSYKFTLLQTRILTQGSQTPNNTDSNFTVMQPSLTRLEANYLLGKLDNTISTFSFDGDDAGKIVLSSRFDGNGVSWDYSLDGKQTWNVVSFSADEEHKLQLTPEQIASITAENDIYVHILGVDYSENNLYKIDITTSNLPAMYNNDLENRLIGATDVMEWRLNDTDEWTLYSKGTPDLTGNKNVEVRVGATGTCLPSVSRKYAFTEDNQPDTRKYIPLSRINLHAFSSEATGGGQNGNVAYALDGNINTRWHSDWNGSDRQRFITVELDEVTFISAVEYVPAGSGNGCVSAGKIYVSMDGENWTEAATFSGWGNNGNTKEVNLPKAREAKYVKFQATSNYGDGRTFISAKMFNFYEDITKICVADFRLDGEEAGKIKIREQYKDLNWQYSIDGGVNWKNVTTPTYQLTNEELDRLTQDNDIKIKFAGNTAEYCIDLEKQVYNETPYVNDLENKLIGIKNASELEWKFNNSSWKSYAEEEPNLTADSDGILYVRKKAVEECLASDIVEYRFTADNQPNNRKYISISNLSMHAYSTQSIDSTRPFYATNLIDGNPNTIWHTDFRYSIVGTRAFVTIELETPKYISALEFTQKRYRQDDPCLIKNAFVYVSENGTDWIEAGRKENCEQNEELKEISFNESIYGKYVKLEIEGYGMFASASMINLYEDMTAKKVADFSFDGENAKKIILQDEYQNLNWKYSLNSGETWKSVNGAQCELSDEEIAKINSNDKIKIRFENREEEYTINIQKASIPNIAPYVNDLENRLIGITNTEALEWKIENKDGWKSYSEKEPVVRGNNKLLIRAKAKGIFTASDILEYNFTDDNQEDTRKYIPVSNLTIAGFSAEDKQQNGAAANAIDGNYNTRWLNSSAGTDNEKYIIIKLDSAVYLSAMDYVPHSENGKILSGKIEGSMDGENFTEIATISGWANNQDTKSIDFEESVKVRFVKITATETSYTSAKRHVGARMFNFYEDITKKEVVRPTATVEYSINNKTNQDVVATLVNPSTEITVLNNNGNTSYTFTENGEFTFEFEDNEGNKGTATARVDWICKTLPEAIFEYNIPTPTNKDVTVTVKFKVNGEFSDEVEILNNDGSNKYVFTESGEFTFRFRGPYGNEGTATANVDWIHKTLPEAIFEYDINETTNKDVTVSVKFKVKGEFNDNVVILNNNGSNTYTFTENGEFTFKFRGPYGNEGIATARVDWINKDAPTANITYNYTELTNKDVIATLSSDDPTLIITNNNGNNTYTFTENGEFTFEFKNGLGNTGTAKAKVDWIDKVAPVPIISYNIIEATNEEVVATISFNKENVTVKDGNTHTFTENGEYTFEFVDKAGNTGTAKAKVTWIDKTLPVAKIEYSTTNLTNQNVVATISFDVENVTVENGNTHTFTENGEHLFKFTTSSGNIGFAKAEVTWIDKKVPEPTMVYSTIEPTTKDVVAAITFDKENVRIVNNNGDRRHTFNENGTFKFEYVDEAGNGGSVNAVVTWIDRIAPTAEIQYNITDKTNKNVVATLINPSEEITITNNEGSNIYTFTENGTFTFEFVDKAGNKGTAKAVVANIDKKLPNATITYSTTNLTNQDVIATISFDKENVTVEGGNTHTFITNGEYVFEYVDEAGNSSMTTAKVTWIDKTAPTAQINYSTTNPTNQNVTVTLVNPSKEITITNNNGTDTYTFTENGTFTFEFVDKLGNKGTAVATVNNIDKKVPVAKITYSTTEQTNRDVIATITFDKENVTITNNNGSNKHTFTQNGEFTFEFTDEAGNKGTAKAVVNWINKEEEEIIISSTKYKIENGFITGIRPKVEEKEGTTVREFKEKIDVNKTVELTIVDKNGKTLNDDNIITTNCKLVVEDQEYVLIVKGDIDCDGEITINDLAKMKLHCIEKQILTGYALKAANLDEDTEVTINDLAVLKLALIDRVVID